MRLAAGQPLDETMHTLAGLQRIQYVFVYPESNDLVLAGPAGDWTTGSEEIPVSTQTGLPIVLLDDLVVVFRHIWATRTPASAAGYAHAGGPGASSSGHRTSG